MNVSKLRTEILSRQAKQAEATQGQIDPKTGRYLAKSGGFSIGSQGVLYPLAMLYLDPASELYQQEDVLKDAIRVGDAMRDFQNPDGSWEFVKEDGSSWGPTHMPWPFLPWLETWQMLGHKLGAQRQERWAAGLKKWCDAVLKRTDESLSVHNIPAYNAVILARASDVLDAPQYLQPAADFLRRVADDQHPDGFWPEGGVPTSIYNMVYGHALGLYYAFTKDEYVLPHLRRYLEFHLHFTYPDGTSVETIDGRVRYKSKPATMGLVGFLPFPEGRRLTQLVVERVLADSENVYLDTGLTYLLQHLAEGDLAEIPQTLDSFAAVYHEHASVRRSGPFFCCLNAYTAPLDQRLAHSRKRWLMDVQNRVGIWHEKTGLIVGGGNSKHQPEFSTFEVFVGGAHYVQPEVARVRSTEQGVDILELDYGPVICELRVTMPEAPDGMMVLRFRATSEVADPLICGGFTLWGVAGKPFLRGGTDSSEKLDPKHSTEFSVPDGASLTVGGVELRLPPKAFFSYPVYPFNPYAIEGVSLPKDTVGAVRFNLQANGECAEVRLRVLP